MQKQKIIVIFVTFLDSRVREKLDDERDEARGAEKDIKDLKSKTKAQREGVSFDILVWAMQGVRCVRRWWVCLLSREFHLTGQRKAPRSQVKGVGDEREERRKGIGREGDGGCAYRCLVSST